MTTSPGGSLRFNMSRPSSLPRVPSSPGATSARHGSAEQSGERVDSFGRPIAWSSITPPLASGNTSPRTTPRSPAGEDGDDSRRTERAERRERRDQEREGRNAAPTEPVGLDFRLRAVEHTLRDHTNELAAQKLMLQQVVEALKGDNIEKKKMEERLDVSFTQSNQKTADMSKEQELLGQRVEMMMASVNALAGTVAGRLDDITKDISNWKQAGSQPNLSPHPPRMAPQTPQSWGVGATTEQPMGPRPASTPIPTAFGAPAEGQSSTQAPTAFGRPPIPNTTGNSFDNFSQGTNQQGPQYHDLRSPNNQWSPLSGNTRPQPHQQPEQSQDWQHTTQNARFGQWAPGAGTETKPFDARDWTVEGKKPSKEMRSFDGNISQYDNWRRRMRDHFISTNCNYATIFRIVETNKARIDWMSIANTQNPELPHLNWQWIAQHLWSITGNYLTDNLMNKRTDMTLGEEFNGLELWRALFNEHCGGSAEMGKTEREFFIKFPKCPKASDLRAHMGKWMEMHQKYGTGLPQEHLVLMFQNILPQDVLSDVKLQRDLRDDLQKQVAYVLSEIETYTNAELSTWNIAKLQNSLKPKAKVPTTIAALATAEMEIKPQQQESLVSVPAPPIPDLASFQANIERMVNAAVSKTAGANRGRDKERSKPPSRNSSAGSNKGSRRTPNPRFNGCWCCGESGHDRANCPVFKSIKAKNNGKVPPGYEGAYEKHMKTQKKAVHSIRTEPVDDEFKDTVPIWPVMRMPQPVPLANSFRDLTDDDDEDDESEVVRALAQLTSNIVFTSQKKSQKSRKGQGMKFNIAHLNAVARDVKAGKITLPELVLADDDEYEYIWALVDSGAGANVARRSHFPHSRKVKAPAISLTAANGTDLPNRGAREIITRDNEGVAARRTFYEADVEMPILSVAEISQEGVEGSDVRFRRKDGYVEDNVTKHRSYFVKRRGVYFTKLYLLKDGMDNPDFVRPGL